MVRMWGCARSAAAAGGGGGAAGAVLLAVVALLCALLAAGGGAAGQVAVPGPLCSRSTERNVTDPGSALHGHAVAFAPRRTLGVAGATENVFAVAWIEDRDLTGAGDSRVLLQVFNADSVGEPVTPVIQANVDSRNLFGLTMFYNENEDQFHLLFERADNFGRGKLYWLQFYANGTATDPLLFTVGLTEDRDVSVEFDAESGLWAIMYATLSRENIEILILNSKDSYNLVGVAQVTFSGVLLFHHPRTRYDPINDLFLLSFEARNATDGRHSVWVGQTRTGAPYHADDFSFYPLSDALLPGFHAHDLEFSYDSAGGEFYGSLVAEHPLFDWQGTFISVWRYREFTAWWDLVDAMSVSNVSGIIAADTGMTHDSVYDHDTGILTLAHANKATPTSPIGLALTAVNVTAKRAVWNIPDFSEPSALDNVEPHMLFNKHAPWGGEHVVVWSQSRAVGGGVDWDRRRGGGAGGRAARSPGAPLLTALPAFRGGQFARGTDTRAPYSSQLPLGFATSAEVKPGLREMLAANFATPWPSHAAASRRQSTAGSTATTTGVATTGVATTGVATTGVATTGVATTGVATTGVATTGVATTGVATTGVATTGVATTGVASPTTGSAPPPTPTTGIPHVVPRDHVLKSRILCFQPDTTGSTGSLLPTTASTTAALPSSTTADEVSAGGDAGGGSSDDLTGLAVALIVVFLVVGLVVIGAAVGFYLYSTKKNKD